MKRTLILLLVFIHCLTAYAQRLSGKVVDAETNEPIPYANVFFANTLIGTNSDIDGNYVLEGFSPGKYDLVVSHVGYITYLNPVALDNEDSQELNIALTPDLVKLSDVYVNADTSGWRYNYEMFKSNFLGRTKNAQKTTILNPKVLYLYFDKEENALYAHAKEPLEIENLALGYHVSYLLKEFSINFSTGRMYSFGIPRIRLIENDKRGRQKKWEKERLRAYNGSLLQFFRSIVTDSLDENGFEVHELFRIPNPNRPPDELIKRKRAELSKKVSEIINTGNSNVTISISGSNIDVLDQELRDSLAYWNRMYRLPKVIDSLGQPIKDVHQLAHSQTNLIEYRGMLQVKYMNEKEEMGYAQMSRRDPVKFQKSTIHFLSDRLTVYENGYYDDVRDVFIEHYWSWSSNIAELLPLEYLPPKD